METPPFKQSATPLVHSDPAVLSGLPTFVGTRVPIDMVLSSLAEGTTLVELRTAWPFLNEEHVRQARDYLAATPNVPARKRMGQIEGAVLISRKRL